MRKLTIILLLLGAVFSAEAQESRQTSRKVVTEFQISDTLTDAFLDTVQVKKKLKLKTIIQFACKS